MLIANMAWEGKAIFAGHFTINNRLQVAAMTDAGNGKTKVYVWTYRKGKFSDPEHWRTINQFYMSIAMYKNICGDFDGNGFDEIATFYSWTDGTVEHNNVCVIGDGFAKQVSQIPFSAYDFEGKIAAMNCDSDARDEIVALYGADTWDTDVYVWNFTGQGAAMSATYSTPYRIPCDFHADNINYKVAAGNYDTDSREEFAALYRSSTDINDFYFIMLDFTDSGIGYYECLFENNFDINESWGRVVSCNYNGDQYDDILYMHQTSGDNSRIYVLSVSWSYVQGGWKGLELYRSPVKAYDASKSTDLMCAGSFTDTVKEDVVTFYKLPETVDYSERSRICMSSQAPDGSMYSMTDYDCKWDPRGEEHIPNAA